MKTKTKVLSLFLCAVLLVVATVFTTVAFLTSEDSVQNTFTVGQVTITLDEATVNTAGEVTSGADRTKTDGRADTNEYHLIPGHTYVKDPTIHVDDDSENCWLFVKLENGLKDIIDDVTIENQMVNENGWVVLDSTNSIYAYKEIVAKGADIDVFDDFKIKDNADVSAYATVKDSTGKVTGGPTIKVTAYAVQADGFTNAASAWAATFGSTSNG